MQQLPLTGIKVLDLSNAVAGGYTSAVLGDLGAEIIKVERPPTGDLFRSTMPRIDGNGAYFLAYARNKRSIVIDYTKPAGRQLLVGMIPKVDILLENLPEEKRGQYGLEYEQVVALNPRIIYAGISAFGPVGPRRADKATDPVMQAYAGFMTATGAEGQDLARVGPPTIDIGAALLCVSATLAALYSGQRPVRVQTSLMDAAVAMMSYQILYYHATGMNPPRLGTGSPSMAPYQAYPTRDGHIIVAVVSEDAWPRFCGAIGRADLAGDPRFVDNAGRCNNREALNSMVNEVLSERSTVEWSTIFAAAMVANSPVNRVEDLMKDPHFIESGVMETFTVGDGRQQFVPGTPFFMDGARLPVRLAPPGLGEHTDQILDEMGIDHSKREQLRRDGVIR